jgi:serine/threonine-protein kinase
MSDEHHPQTELITYSGIPDVTIKSAPIAGNEAAGAAVDRTKLRGADPLQEDHRVALQNRFPEYQIHDALGQGGMSTVYRVHDGTLGRDVALKVLRLEWIDEGAAIEKFVNEARITAQLNHPNIPAVYALESRGDGMNVFTMKMLEGRTLHDVIIESERAGRDATAEVVEILLRICDALAFAHSKGVLHLDLKPANVFVANFGQIYLVDWGIAKRLSELPAEPIEPDTVEGTPSYMAPEQARGEPWKFDARTDIFALGGLLYRVLSGRPPHPASTAASALVLAATAQVVPPNEVAAEKGRTVPGRLVSICMKAMAPDSEHRYESVAEFQQDLARYARGLTHLPQRAYQAGEIIFAEGDRGDAAYVIISGGCAVTRQVGDRIQELRRLGVGEMFGEAAVFLGNPRSATVRAITDTVVGVVDQALLREEMERKSFMSLAIRTVTSTFLDLDQQLARERQRSRVIELALRHAARHGERGRTPWKPLLEMLVERTGASEDDITSWLLGAEGVAIDDESLFLLD